MLLRNTMPERVQFIAIFSLPTALLLHTEKYKVRPISHNYLHRKQQLLFYSNLTLIGHTIMTKRYRLWKLSVAEKVHGLCFPESE